ncbi:unnamed protein product [Rhizophagus irregularis]|uniref:Uncharacterized protein n=1 Tax=Rhizophagus irregularis TaxID=588596 RepID=A0A915YQI2_9GLOM|nr:unnamed protein product [Rhizophagus irregularis]
MNEMMLHHKVDDDFRITKFYGITQDPGTENYPSTSLGISYKSHSGAIYTSRLLSFNNLPEPKNSVDYYEQIDNIISKEFSESLQINISQLNINENESSQINISQLNVEEDNQNSESESKRKNCFLSQNDESESKRKKIRIE